MHSRKVRPNGEVNQKTREFRINITELKFPPRSASPFTLSDCIYELNGIDYKDVLGGIYARTVGIHWKRPQHIAGKANCSAWKAGRM